MKYRLIFTTLFLSTCLAASSVAQDKETKETNPNAQGESAAPTSNKSDGTKGEVELLLEELKKRNDRVLGSCTEDCTNSVGLITNVVVGRFINKRQPSYPALARAAHAAGEVVVQLVIDEEGDVMAAQVVSGHPLLRATCIKATKETRFEPTLFEGKPVKVYGVITYKFALQ